MYFVVRGALSYELDCSFAEQLPQDAESGAWISEAALWCHWRHMGCAEAQGRKGAACCEVLLLKSADLMPILTRSGLIGQLAWAYARSFHHFLQNFTPPICDWPNDLVLPFEVDEVIAGMPKDATAVIGKGAIEVLTAPHESILASWLHAVRQDNIQKLASEVLVGASTLLVKGKVVVRCVPLVVLQLHRRDGRMFVRMRFDSKADGGREATCKLPGGKQLAGEHPNGCLQRLLDGKLKPLADGIELVGMERQSEQRNSRTFGVPTRYVRTVVSAEWQESDGVAGALQQWRMLTVDPTVSRSSSKKYLRRNASTPFPAPRALSRGSSVSSSLSEVRLGGDVFMFQEDVGFYVWLTKEQFAFAQSPHGQHSLSTWLTELFDGAGVDPDTAGADETWKNACLSMSRRGKGIDSEEPAETLGSARGLELPPGAAPAASRSVEAGGYHLEL
jgi:hypothetical protein